MSFIPNRLIRFEEYEIDRAQWQLSWCGEHLPLNRKTFDLLVYLVDHADRVVGKGELLSALWPESFVEESNLTQHIFLLRKALSRHGSGAKIIETVPGRGYRFAIAVAVVGAEQSTADRMVIRASESITRITLEEEEVDAPEMVPQRVEVTPSLLPAASGKRRVYWIAGGSVAAVALCVAGWFGWQRWLDHTGGQPIDVVLTPMDGTTGDKVLDAALVDALRMDLSQSPFVSVVSPSRVRATLAEMMHKPDDVMTPAISREVCERTNSQAVLQGSIARIGSHFLLTEEATSCVNGAALAETRQEVVHDEDLPHAVDTIAESLRRKLGESRRSIARFDTPLLPMKTASLEALKNFSEAEVLAAQGKATDAIGLDKKAIAADPDFATAWFDLAALYGSTEQYTAEREALVKAYSLRDSATEPVRLAITALYLSSVTQDLYEAERNYRNWTELYPRSPQAWNGLSVVQRDLGHHADALVSARQALELRPTIQGLYSNLAHEQKLTGDIKGSIATCEKAIARGLDGDYIRSQYFTDAYALKDASLVQKQTAWEAAHPDAAFLRIAEAEVAIGEARFADAHRFLSQADLLLRRQGLTSTADEMLRAEASNLIETGDVAAGKQLFQTVKPDPKEEYTVVGLAWMGETTAAEAALHAMQVQFPQGTIWNDYRAPEVQAILAMSAHKPKEAIVALERARALEGRDPLLPMLRGNAYLEAGEPALAESEYRRVLGRPWLGPEMEEVPLSWLGLARALAVQSKRTSAIDAYQHFFTLWAHADPDAMYLKQARQEFSTLPKVDSKEIKGLEKR